MKWKTFDVNKENALQAQFDVFSKGRLKKLLYIIKQLYVFLILIR